jgi:hypothetical protein
LAAFALTGETPADPQARGTPIGRTKLPGQTPRKSQKEFGRLVHSVLSLNGSVYLKMNQSRNIVSG